MMNKLNKDLPVLVFDMGGTDLKYGVIKQGQFLYKNSEPTITNKTQHDLENQYIKLTKQMLELYPDIIGVGVSVAGGVDIYQRKIIVAPAAIPVFKDFDYYHLFMDNFKLDSFVDNDVNTFAMSEVNQVPYKNFIMMTVGTGIGGGIIVNGELIHGVNFNGGEIGRMLIDDLRYELHASISSLVTRANKSGLTCKNGLEVFNLYDQNNEIAKDVVTYFYRSLAKGIANLIYILDPEAIIIGGGVTNRKTFIQELTPYVNEFLTEGFKNVTALRCATYQNDGGLIGAYNNFINERIIKND